MSWSYSLEKELDLCVTGRITPRDAERQQRAAGHILECLKDRAGMILADEVGMGKTFVALAVAASVALRSKRPVVVLVPSAVLKKWERDAITFRESCLPGKRDVLQPVVASNAVEFLRLVDDAPGGTRRLIFLSHTAMSGRMKDPWVKLALVKACMKGRWGNDELKGRVARFAEGIINTRRLRLSTEVYRELLDRQLSDWRNIFVRHGIPLNNETGTAIDDPVPEALIKVLDALDLKRLYDALCENLPQRSSPGIDQRLRKLRQALQDNLAGVWSKALGGMDYHLPLLIVDEAHHLKNAGTRKAKLFSTTDETRGALAGNFERMLFLTATPFQLGHHELCAVLRRFDGLAWNSRSAPPGGQEGFMANIDKLHAALDESQHQALALENAWGRLTRNDLVVGDERFDNVEDWWRRASVDTSGLTPAGVDAVQRFRSAEKKLRDVEAQLRYWVVRHTRSFTLPGAEIERRLRRAGRSALPGQVAAHDAPGLEINGEALLPFLLSNRLVAVTPSQRAVFAEGLASSYATFLGRLREDETRALDEAAEEDLIEESHAARAEEANVQTWYLNAIRRCVDGDAESEATHPKIRVTVERTMHLWAQGEKVLVFCYYLNTVRTLRRLISLRMQRAILERAAQKRGIDVVEAEAALQDYARELGRTAPERACRQEVEKLLAARPVLACHATEIHEVVLRFLRRESYIVRFLDMRVAADEAVRAAFASRDHHGLRVLVETFLEFLAVHCRTDEERDKYLSAIGSIQTGDIKDADEPAGAGLAANVRSVYGATDHESREKLYLAFNSPFYPEVLISTSVASEGVDLHLHCRHVIHHDLAWNPSSIEQRTGRLDRIGAKAERVLQPVEIAMPYVAATQDEKMYRVVTDRERWFSIIMGGSVNTSVLETEALAERLPLPDTAVAALTLHLGVDGG